jgi:hypothetical protein
VAGAQCSLRQIIAYENRLSPAPSPADTIVVPAGEYDLANGALTITTNLSILGAGADQTSVVQVGTKDRVFAVEIPGTDGPPLVPTVTISGLAMTFGQPPVDGESGGNVYTRAR